MILTNTKDFLWEKKKAHIHHVLKKNQIKSPDFYDKF